MRYLIFEEGRCVNAIEADANFRPAEGQTAIPSDTGGPDPDIRLEGNEVVDRRKKEKPDRGPKTAPFALFMDQFTDAEQLKIVRASMEDPQVKLWYDRALASGRVSLEDPRVRQTIEPMVEKKRLTKAFLEDTTDETGLV